MRRGLFKNLHEPAHKSARVFRDHLGRSAAEREEAVFDYVLRYAIEHMGHTPTLREIGDRVDINSTSVIGDLLQRLISKDKLREYDGLLIIPGSSFSWQPRDKAADSAPPKAHRSAKYRNEGGVQL